MTTIHPQPIPRRSLDALHHRAVKAGLAVEVREDERECTLRWPDGRCETFTNGWNAHYFLTGYLAGVPVGHAKGLVEGQEDGARAAEERDRDKLRVMVVQTGRLFYVHREYRIFGRLSWEQITHAKNPAFSFGAAVELAAEALQTTAFHVELTKSTTAS